MDIKKSLHLPREIRKKRDDFVTSIVAYVSTDDNKWMVNGFFEVFNANTLR